MPFVAIAVVLAVLVLLLLKVPVALALLLPSIGYIILFDIPFVLIVQNMTRSIFTFTIVTVPLFILMGKIMNHSGQTDILLEFADDAVGHFKGGLAQVNIVASLIFSGISGSALADIGGIGQVLIHSMEENGYSKPFSAALTSASSTIGPIFPPSVPLILYGVLAEESVLHLLLAGALPAILAVISLMVVTYALSHWMDFPEGSKSNRRDIATSLVKAFPILLAPAILIGGMLSGSFGPAEIAAIAALYLIAIDIFIYRNLDLSYVFEASREAVMISASVLFILMAASLFGIVMSFEGVTRMIASVLLDISSNEVVLLFIVCLLLLGIGLILEPLTALVMTIPIFVPPLVSIGVDPIHLGLLMVYTLMIGLLTPPVGLTLYVASDVSGAKVEQIIKALLPFYIALIAVLIILILVPDISLVLLDFI